MPASQVVSKPSPVHLVFGDIPSKHRERFVKRAKKKLGFSPLRTTKTPALSRIHHPIHIHGFPSRNRVFRARPEPRPSPGQGGARPARGPVSPHPLFFVSPWFSPWFSCSFLPSSADCVPGGHVVSYPATPLAPQMAMRETVGFAWWKWVYPSLIPCVSFGFVSCFCLFLFGRVVCVLSGCECPFFPLTQVPRIPRVFRWALLLRSPNIFTKSG